MSFAACLYFFVSYPTFIYLLLSFIKLHLSTCLSLFFLSITDVCYRRTDLVSVGWPVAGEEGAAKCLLYVCNRAGPAD